MRSYIIKRIIYAVIIAWGILTVTFVLLRVGPSSPVDRYILNIAAHGQDVQSVTKAIESRYGLDKPLYEQYFAYMGNLLQGKWGWSFSASKTVLDLIGEHWIYSFQLILLATILAIFIGVGLGMLAAVRRNTRTDYGISIFSFMGISVPGFWLGLMLILVFAVYLGFFKTFYDTSYPIWSLQNLRQLILPVFTLAIGELAGYVRYTRSAMLDNLRKEFVTTARAKGLPERTVIGKHVLRNAVLPLVTIIMFDLGSVVFGGAYLTEIVFGIPGLGQVSFNAIFANDYPVVIAVTLIGTFLVLFINLATDVVYTYLDPRIRYD